MKTSLKLALPKFSVASQKIWVAQNLGGGEAAAPLAPPARTPMFGTLYRINRYKFKVRQISFQRI